MQRFGLDFIQRIFRTVPPERFSPKLQEGVFKKLGASFSDVAGVWEKYFADDELAATYLSGDRQLTEAELKQLGTRRRLASTEVAKEYLLAFLYFLKRSRGGEEAQRMTMKTSPNAYAIPIRERGKTVYQEIAGYLLVPDRIWVDTAHVVSLLSDEQVISNIFYAVRLKNENQERLKALCLWFSTTWGILTALASREETRGAFVRLKQSQWRLLPVLDIDKLTKNQITGLAAVFEEFKEKQLSRIPEQYGSSGKVDALRIELDSAFLSAIGIEVNVNDLLLLYHEIGSSLRQWIGD